MMKKLFVCSAMMLSIVRCCALTLSGQKSHIRQGMALHNHRGDGDSSFPELILQDPIRLCGDICSIFAAQNLVSLTLLVQADSSISIFDPIPGNWYFTPDFIGSINSFVSLATSFIAVSYWNRQLSTPMRLRNIGDIWDTTAQTLLSSTNLNVLGQLVLNAALLHERIDTEMTVLTAMAATMAVFLWRVTYLQRPIEIL